ncbi:MAG: DUF1292 domain-containing protein [Tumebacillaceae bacterium]|jgi:uncharacterized protein YrzB (UPF0473 family)
MSDVEKVETNKIITLIDDEGQEADFEVIEILELEDKTYAVMMPVDSEDDEAFILRVENDEDGNPTLTTIDDDAEYETVAEVFDTLYFQEQGGNDKDLL